MPIMIQFDGGGGTASSWVEDHEHWDDGFDRCGTCGADIGPQQVGREYAVHRADNWHIATWDGEVFKVTSNFQSGDRWSPEWVDRRVLLPRNRHLNHQEDDMGSKITTGTTADSTPQPPTKEQPMTGQKPTIGRTVIYRVDGRNGLVYDLPAIITCTADTHPGDYPDGRINPLPVPDEGCAHLTVFTPGGFGTRVTKDDTHYGSAYPEQFPGAGEMFPGSGTYVEWNVPANAMDGGNVERRTWRWPERS